MTKQIFPFVSVIVVTFNRIDQLIPCLESLKRQTYPRERYEVIVIDDGSTDGTAHIAQAQGVRVIRHETNRGISSARNTGFMAANGEITAYIDDDAVADHKWLEYLVQPFDAPEVIASGGRTLAYKTDFIAERYLSATGYGNPAPFAFGKSKNPLWRFLIYLKSMFSPIATATKVIEVQAIFTLNAAYRTSTLRDIGGFDEALLTDEDTDLSARLRKKGFRIIFVPDAIIRHRHRESLTRLIRQTYHRAENTLHYYTKEGKVLPIFPLPFLYLAIIVFLIIIRPVVGISFIIFGPPLLYCWWLVRAFRNRSFEYILYGYIQLILESATVLGLARGKFHSRQGGTVVKYSEPGT